jgi:hypothetical protein
MEVVGRKIGNKDAHGCGDGILENTEDESL